MRILIVLCFCMNVLVMTGPTSRAAIVFDFDYTYDTGFFNSNAQARTMLQQAGATLTARLVDNLGAITPGSGDTWTAVISNPATGQAPPSPITNLTIPTNTIKVYVGARSLGGPLAVGGPGGFSGSGSQSFVDAVSKRGQSGVSSSVPSSDFGPWGGTVAFDNSRNWNFSSNAPSSGQDDFFSVAIHELAHVLGYGTAKSWQTLLTATLTPFNKTQYVGPFKGAKATALYGANVPLETPPAQATSADPVIHAQHFAANVMSQVGTVNQQPIMSASITTGTRKQMTKLDWATLDDLGWDLARNGDANADGTVDLSDLALLASRYGQSGTWSTGDFNDDGLVDLSDLALLAANYGSTGIAGAPVEGMGSFDSDWAFAQASVPEPGTGLFAGAALLLLCKRNRPT